MDGSGTGWGLGEEYIFFERGVAIYKYISASFRLRGKEGMSPPAIL